MLLLKAAQGLEIFAQPTAMDLLRILLAVLLWKGTWAGTQLLGSGASRINVILVLTEIPYLRTL